MKLYSKFALFAFLITIQAACTKNKPNPEEMIEAAKMLDSQIMAAINSHDIDLFIANYWKSPDLLVLDVNQVIKGAEKWKTAVKEWLNANPSLKAENIESHYIVSEDLVLGWKTWKSTAPDKNGEAKSSYGLTTDVFAIRDGKWVIISESIALIKNPL